MPNQQLIDYIKQSTEQGQSREQIKAALLGAGWQEGDVEMAFSAAVGMSTPVPPPTVVVSPLGGVQMVQTVQANVAQVIYGGFWIRYLALTLDSFIISFTVALPIGIIVILIGMALGVYEKTSIGFSIFAIGMNLIGGIILPYIYFIVFTNRRQATIGKRLLGLRVVSVDGSRLSLGKIILRETLGKIISVLILGIGYLMVAFTSKKQGLHDKLAGSVVISNPEERKTWAMVVAIIFAAVLPAIAILGIVASITLASLNSARAKGEDEAVKANLAIIRATAEMSYDMNGSYRNILSDSSVVNSIRDAEAAAGAKAVTNVTDTAYAIYLPLKKPTPPATGWCVDSTGFSQQSVSLGTATSCSPGKQVENRERVTNDDISKVKSILDDISQGYLTGNKTLVIKHSSTETNYTLSSTEIDPVTSFAVNNVFQEGKNIVANTTVLSAGKSNTADMVFIREEGNWEFDIRETMQRGITQGMMLNTKKGMEGTK